MTTIQNLIDKCLLAKLAKNADESETHSEYGLRLQRLETNFDSLLRALSELKLNENVEESAKVLASVFILFKELLTKGPWNSGNVSDYAQKLNVNCQVLYEVELKYLFQNTYEFDNQVIFDSCMQNLLLKLTSNEFKKYPSLVEVFCSIIVEIQNNKNVLTDAKALSVSMYLMDDFVLSNKKKGLQCFQNTLQHLKPETFSEGNYYEVVYISLKKVFLERDLDITKLVVDCLKELLKVLPEKSEFKLSKPEELYANVLEQVQVESNLYRKAVLFDFIKYLTEIIGVNAARRKMFMIVICDNLDLCNNEGVKEILLVSVLECLQEWINTCWCVWKLSDGQKLLSSLFKTLYVSNENIVNKTSRIIATLITLCDKEDKERIVQNLQESKINDNEFMQKLEYVNKYICL